MDPTCAICEQDCLLGKDCHLIGMTSWVTGPGRTDQGLHNDYLPIDGIPSVRTFGLFSVHFPVDLCALQTLP